MNWISFFFYSAFRAYTRIEARKHTVPIPAHQARAIHKLLPSGRFKVKARKLSMIDVIGCTCANQRTAPLKVSVGAKPELIKGRIKRGNMNPLEASGVLEINPHNTASMEITKFTSSKSPIANSQSLTSPCG